MTLDQIRASDAAFIRAVDVAPVIRADPQYIRDTARTNPAALGFPVTVIGSRVKIPRIPFLKFIGEEATTA